MIPKIIHYCWFGGKPLPKTAIKCINSWRRNMPGYKIKQWDETNFDISAIEYIREAYNKKLFAFVSDYARFWILEKEGGYYLDIDVEIIKSVDELICKGPFMGIESGIMVNPGLGIASEPHMSFLKQILHIYENLKLVKPNGSVDYDTVVIRTTNLMINNGWTGSESKICGFYIYPKEFFCPLDYETKRLVLTNSTYTIHYYNASWLLPHHKLYRFLKKVFGEKFVSRCSKFVKNLS